MLDRGAFAGVDAAMMVHPAALDIPRMPCLAVSDLRVTYTGKEAHSSAAPELGVNAASAFVVAQTAIGLLREHTSPEARIHGIVTHGGDAPNVVPAHTSGRWLVREKTLADLAPLEEKVRRCFEAGALATGAEVEIELSCPQYSEFRDDPRMMALYRANAEALGRSFPDLGPLVDRMAGSTDMANVSLAIPSIHPIIGIDCFPAVNHQPEFTAHCIRPAADQAVLDGATGMAWTVIDLARELAATA